MTPHHAGDPSAADWMTPKAAACSPFIPGQRTPVSRMPEGCPARDSAAPVRQPYGFGSRRPQPNSTLAQKLNIPSQDRFGRDDSAGQQPFARRGRIHEPGWCADRTEGRPRCWRYDTRNLDYSWWTSQIEPSWSPRAERRGVSIGAGNHRERALTAAQLLLGALD